MTIGKLKRFREIITLFFLTSLFITGYLMLNYFTIQLIQIALSSFFIGLLWLTLVITDEESENYMILKEGKIIEFAKIIIGVEHNKESLDIKKPDIHHIKKDEDEKDGGKYNETN